MYLVSAQCVVNWGLIDLYIIVDMYICIYECIVNIYVSEYCDQK
jgi:hypothetical protein